MEATSDAELRSLVFQGYEDGEDAKDGIENHIEPEPLRVRGTVNNRMVMPSDGDVAVVNSADRHCQHDDARDKRKYPA
jgi:hypothetical protein